VLIAVGIVVYLRRQGSSGLTDKITVELEASSDNETTPRSIGNGIDSEWDQNDFTLDINAATVRLKSVRRGNPLFTKTGRTGSVGLLDNSTINGLSATLVKSGDHLTVSGDGINDKDDFDVTTSAITACSPAATVEPEVDPIVAPDGAPVNCIEPIDNNVPKAWDEVEFVEDSQAKSLRIKSVRRGNPLFQADVDFSELNARGSFDLNSRKSSRVSAGSGIEPPHWQENNFVLEEEFFSKISPRRSARRASRRSSYFPNLAGLGLEAKTIQPESAVAIDDVSDGWTPNFTLDADTTSVRIKSVRRGNPLFRQSALESDAEDEIMTDAAHGYLDPAVVPSPTDGGYTDVLPQDIDGTIFADVYPQPNMPAI